VAGVARVVCCRRVRRRRPVRRRRRVTTRLACIAGGILPRRHLAGISGGLGRRSLARKELLVRDQRVDEVQDVDREQRDRDGEVERPGPDLRQSRRRGAVRRRNDQRDHGERQHRRLRARGQRVVLLLVLAQAAEEHRQAEREEHVPEDRARERRLHHVVEAGAQRGEGDDQLGHVAEGRVEQAADAGARLLGEVLGRLAHRRGERHDRERRREEDEHRLVGGEVLERERDRHEDQQPLHRASPLPRTA
jgi:hypothetical protein